MGDKIQDINELCKLIGKKPTLVDWLEDDESVEDFIKGEKRMTRPKKNAPEGWVNVNIQPLANGYMVTTQSNVEKYVFNNWDDMIKFIKTNLQPTTEQTRFINGI